MAQIVVTTTDSEDAVKAAMGDKGKVAVRQFEDGKDTQSDTSVQDTGVVSTDNPDADENDAASDDDKSSTDSAAVGDKESKVSDKVQTKIDTLVKKIGDLEGRLVAATTPKETKTTTDDKPKTDEEPKAEDFDSNADYVKALSKWTVKQERIAQKAEDQKEEATARSNKVLSNWNAQIKAAKTKYSDWDDTMGDTEVGTTAARMLVESPDGAELSYYIGKNPEEAEVLAALTSEREVAMAIGELRFKVKAANKDKPKVTEKPQGKEKPKPITPVGGSSSGNVEKKPKNMAYQEYKAHRNRQEAEKRKAQGG